MITLKYRSAVTSIYHFDVIGSADRLTNSLGLVTDSYLYRAFGILVASSGGSMNPWKYIGRLEYSHDADTLQYYVRIRYYDPATARFVSRDRIERPLYAYVQNRPIAVVDPTGTTAACTVGFQPPGSFPGSAGGWPAGTICDGLSDDPDTRFDYTHPFWKKPCFSPKEVAKCLEAHEDEQFANLKKSKCCEDYRKCFKNFNFNDCNDAYNAWFKLNVAAFECCAAKKSGNCFSGLVSDSKRSKECRCAYLKEAQRLRELEWNMCFRARAGMGFPRGVSIGVTPCPFDRKTGQPKTAQQIQNEARAGPFTEICTDFGRPVFDPIPTTKCEDLCRKEF